MEYPIIKDISLTEKKTNRIHLISMECQFEVFINDISLFKVMGEITKNGGGINNNNDINQLLLTSGTHEIKVKIYPKYGLHYFDKSSPYFKIRFYQFLNRDLGTLIYNEAMKGSNGIELSSFDQQWIDEKGVYGESNYVEAHYEAKEPIKFEGLPFYEWRSAFDAEVPFNLTGWRNSVNLRKEQEDEKKNIKTEVIEEYKKIYQIIKNRDVTAYLSLVKEREELITTTLCYKENEKELRKNEFVKLIQNTDYELEPLFEETFQLEYQGYGKLVTLLHLTDKEGIIRLKNKKDP